MRKNSFRLFLIAVAAVVAFLAAQESARAVIITTVKFYGTITELSSVGPYWNRARTGDPFTVTVQYNDTPSYANPAGQYRWDTGVATFTAEFGSYSFKSNNLEVVIWNQQGFAFYNSEPFSSEATVFRADGLQLQFRYFTSPFPSDTSLNAITYYPVEPANNKYFLLSAETKQASARGDFTYYTIERFEVVPEPSTWALLGSGGAALAFAMIRRRVAVGESESAPKNRVFVR